MVMIYLIIGAVSFIALICFFVLCFNVSRIKKELGQEDSRFLHHKFNKARAFNDTDEARELLKQLIWSKIIEINNDNYEKESRLYKYGELEESYKDHLLEYQINFPNKEIALRS